MFPFDFEVVVADNASTDDTQAVLSAAAPTHYRLRVVRNTRNTGVIPNLLNALRQGWGEFCVYLADDDRLDPANLTRSVEHMRAEPDLVATYAGWHKRDVATDQVLGIAGGLPDATYTREQAGDLVDAMLRVYLFPELAIYRSATLARVLFPGATLFWPYLLIDRLFRLGRIASCTAPFYSVLAHPEGDVQKLVSAGSGHQHRVWASIRDGMDFLNVKYNPRSDPRLNDPVSAAYRAYIGNQSFYSSLHRRHFGEAFETALPLAACNVLTADRSDRQWESFITHVALENFQRCFETMAGIDGILCIGFAPEAFGQLTTVLAECAGDHPLPVSAAALMAPEDSFMAKAILTPSDLEREILIARGHPQGQVLSLEDLLRVFSL